MAPRGHLQLKWNGINQVRTPRGLFGHKKHFCYLPKLSSTFAFCPRPVGNVCLQELIQVSKLHVFYNDAPGRIHSRHAQYSHYVRIL